MHTLGRSLLIRGLLFASVVASLTCGCGDSNRAKIIGTWGIEQADTVMRRVDRSGAGAETEDAATVSESADPPKMILKFHRDGRLVTSTSMGVVNQEKKGSWKLLSFDEPSNTMTISCDIQMQESEHDVEFIDPNTIELVPPNMAGTTMKLKFKRQ